jgi:urate oxidase
MMNQSQNRTMFYGKGDVSVYRTFVKPLTGLRPIPESSFTERNNTIFGFNCNILLKGNLSSISSTKGNNSLVVATESIKNFIQCEMANFQGNTAEGFIRFICDRFLNEYSHVDTVELTAHEMAFNNVFVPKGEEYEQSELVFKRSRNEYATTTIKVARTSIGNLVVKHTSGIVGVQLIKIKGISTDIPETSDYPLFICLDFEWEYLEIEDASGLNPDKYVAAEQVVDIANSVFHELNCRSIEELTYQIGLRVLERFPQLSSIEFKTNNCTWKSVVEMIPNSEGGVYMEASPLYGFQGFIVTKKDLSKKNATGI